MLLSLTLALALACTHPLRDSLRHHERGITSPSVEVDPGARLPPPAPRILVGPDAIMIDALAWELQPAFAEAGLGAELDAVARQVAEPIPLVDGRAPVESRRGLLINRLYDHMVALHEASGRVAEATGQDRHRTGKVRLLVDESLPASTLTQVLYTSGQAMHSDVSLEVEGPRGRTGLQLSLPGMGTPLVGPLLRATAEGAALHPVGAGEAQRWSCHLPGCAPVEGAVGLERFMPAASVDAGLAGLTWPQPDPEVQAEGSDIAHMLRQLATQPRPLLLVAAQDQARVGLVVELLARADRRVQGEQGLLVIVGDSTDSP